MSRSHRNNPIIAVTSSESEKQEKRKANRALRKAVRHAIAIEAEIMPLPENVGNVYAMSKDGKTYIDPKKFPKSMRK